MIAVKLNEQEMTRFLIEQMLMQVDETNLEETADFFYQLLTEQGVTL